MKKVSGLFASLLLVVLCMVGCGETETPTPQESLQDIRVTGTYVQSSAPSESRIYVYKEKQVNYLQTVGISSQLFQVGNDFYMMVLTNGITEVYVVLNCYEYYLQVVEQLDILIQR